MTLFDRIALVVDTTNGAYFKYMNKHIYIEVDSYLIAKDLVKQLKQESIRSAILQNLNSIYVMI